MKRIVLLATLAALGAALTACSKAEERAAPPPAVEDPGAPTPPPTNTHAK